MKGVCFLTTESRLVARSDEFLAERPKFFHENSDTILLHWLFNTEDDDSMVTLLRAFKDQLLTQAMVKEFLSTIEYDYLSLQQRVKSKPGTELES